MSVVADYQEQTEALAASTAASVLALYTALQGGGLTPAVVVPAMAAVIARANAAATTLADVAVSTQIETAAGVPSPPTGIAPTDDTDRLTKAVSTILDDLPEPAEAAIERPTGTQVAPDAASEAPDPAEVAGNRLQRLARSEPLEAGQAIVVEIVNRLPEIEGWTRVLDADPCERCVRWAEDGRVFPKDAHFKRHLNCNCQQQIVTRKGMAS